MSFDKSKISKFYAAVLDVDFDTVTDADKLVSAFNAELRKYVSFVQTETVGIKTITELSEAFTHSAYGAAYLQLKALGAEKFLESKSKPDDSLKSFIQEKFRKAELKNNIEDSEEGEFSGWDDLDDVTRNVDKKIASLAEEMAEPFAYSGSCMRALVATAISSFCAGHKNSNFDKSYRDLLNFKPTKFLLDQTEKNDRYAVIGKVNSYYFNGGISTSPHRENRFEPFLESEEADVTLSAVFADRLHELFNDNSESDLIGKTRLAELRQYFLRTVCGLFLDIHFQHLPRVFSLVHIVNTNCDENGHISVSKLKQLCPPECEGLINDKAILSKAVVGMKSTYYTINSGLLAFVKVVSDYNLLFNDTKEIAELFLTDNRR